MRAPAALAAMATLLFAGPPQELASKAGAAWRAKSYPEALLAYQKVAELRPDSSEALYNMGTALYKVEDYERALDAFERAAQLARRGKVAARARYNAGNSAFYHGLALVSKDPRGALGMMERALDAYREALRLDRGLPDAAYNAEVVKKWLRLLEEHFVRQQGPDGPPVPGPPGPAQGDAADDILERERARGRNRQGAGTNAAPLKVEKDW
jgi:tetratricopeptide (TPR) repeat protein